jgi:hypothetical protein
MAKRGFRQGWFTPKNPRKYRGDSTKIRYMSSWELHADRFLDGNPNVLEWSSEEIAIPYIKPTDRQIHSYYPDYWIKYRNKRGEIVEEIWEVKPNKQTKTPSKIGKRRNQQLVESVMYAINKAKWHAAEIYCKKRGIKFKLVTEKDLFK